MSDIVDGLRANNALPNTYYTISVETLREAADEIERLRADLLTHDGQAQELQGQLCKWKARAQVMREYLTQYSGQSTTLWRDFCRVHPETREWFYEDGVPRD